MNYLKELHLALTGISFNKVLPDILQEYTPNQEGGREPGLKTFFDLLRKGKAKDDGEAFRLLREKHPGLSRKQYGLWKTRLFNRLSNLVTLIDPNNFQWEPYKKAYFNAHKQLMIARFLAITRFMKASVYSAKKGLSLARKYEFYDLYTNLTAFLANAYADRGDRKAYRSYKNAYWSGLAYYKGEQEAIFAYQDWAVYFFTHSKFDKAMQNQMMANIEHLEKILEDTPTFLVRLYLVRLKSIYYELTYRFSNVIELWEDFHAHVMHHSKFRLKIQEFESALKKMAACLNNKNYDKGTLYAWQAKNLFPPGQLNWFIFHEYWFLLLVHKQDFVQANQILETILNHPYYKHLPDAFKEKWVLMNGYMAFVIESYWDPEFSHRFSENRKQFRINKFMNQFPEGSRDKSGINTMVLILKFLFFLNRNDFQSLISLHEPFKAYYYRYLRHVTEKRKLAKFVNMLNKVLKHNFDPEKTAKATQKDFQLLTQTRLFYEGGYEDLEILPFEEIWEWILGRLQESADSKESTNEPRVKKTQ